MKATTTKRATKPALPKTRVTKPKKKYKRPGQGAMIKPKQIKKNPGVAGRKTVVLPIEQAEQWGFLQATHEDMAAMLGVSRKRISEEFTHGGLPDTEFVTLYKRGKAKSRMSLRKAMFNKAMEMESGSISIFTTKNMLGWTDKTEIQTDAEIIIRSELGPKPRFVQDLTKDPTARN
jgi:hypothetical protein